MPYDIRNYAVMRVFGIFLWGSPLKCHGDIMRVYDFKRLGTLYLFLVIKKLCRFILKNIMIVNKKNYVIQQFDFVTLLAEYKV